MKRITLQFKSRALERKYQKSITALYVPQITKLLNFFIILIVIPCLILGVIFQKYYDVLIYSIGGILLLGVKYAIKKYTSIYNLLINSLLLGTQLMAATKLYQYGPSIGEIDTYALFYFGGLMIQIQSSIQNLSYSFLLSLGQLIIQNAVFLSLTWDTSIYSFKYTYIVYNGFTIFFMYQQLKEKKEIFMFRENERQWAKIVKNGLSQQIITVKYNQKVNTIQLDIVNRNAMHKFKIYNENDFKNFSRKLKVFTQFQDIYQINQSQKLINNEVDMSTGGMTLENQIINFMKQSISENDKKIDEMLQNEVPPQIGKLNGLNKSQISRMKSKSNNNLLNKRVVSYYTQISSSDEPQKHQKYKIKLSYFQSQANHQCCIVFDQESDQQKVKNLVEANKRLQTDFIQICIQLDRAKQYLFLTLNKLYNVCDHHFYISKHFYRNKIKLSKIESLCLGNLQERIKEIFIDQQQHIQFKFINCSADSIIFTNLKKLTQIFVNFIQNSLKHDLDETLKSTHLMTQSKQQIDFSCSPQGPKLLNSSIAFNEILAKESFSLEPYLQKKQPSIIKQSKRLTVNQLVTIKFEVIEGDNEQSNIIKVYIKDKSGGMSIEHLFEVFKTISYQKQKENYDHSSFNNLGWKISCHTIGQLGPYSDFFVSPNCQTGLKVCFFLYMNMSIIDEIGDKITFQNKKFFENYQKLLQKYYHKNSKLSQYKFLISQSQEIIREEQSKFSQFQTLEDNLENANNNNNQYESMTEHATVNRIYSFSNFQFKEFRNLSSFNLFGTPNNFINQANQIKCSESIRLNEDKV